MRVSWFSLLLFVNTLKTASAGPYPALPRITPAPKGEIKLRDVYLSTISNYESMISNSNFIGWFNAGSGTTLGITCGSDSSGNYATWSTQGTFGACCYPGQFCDQVLSCSRGYLIYSAGTPWQCPTSDYYYQCGTQTVYASSGGPGVSSVDCFVDNYSAWTLIHDISAGTTSTSTKPTSISSSPTSTIPPPTSTTTDSSSASDSGASKSTVVGAVLGALLGAAIIVGLGVFVYFRRRQKTEIENLKNNWSAHTSGTPMVYYGPQTQLHPAELRSH